MSTITLDTTVVCFSPSQQCFQIESLGAMLNTNRSSYGAGQMPDYVPLVLVANTHLALNLIDRITAMGPMPCGVADDLGAWMQANQYPKEAA